MARRIGVRLLVLAMLATACTGRTSPAQTPSPPTKVDFVPLWPEHTPAQLSASQQRANAGDESLYWRLHPETVATRFATEVLRWTAVDVRDLADTWAPKGHSEQARVQLCKGVCGSGWGFQETVHLQRVSDDPGSLWAVTSLQASNLQFLPAFVDDPIGTPTVSVGRTLRVFTTSLDRPRLPSGTRIEAGSVAWNCPPNDQASPRPLWFGTLSFPVLAASQRSCTKSPGFVYVLHTDTTEILGSHLLDSTYDLPPIDSLAATAVTLEREPGRLPPPPPRWTVRDPLSLRDCRPQELTLKRPSLSGDMPPRPYGLGITASVKVRRGSVCRAHFAITLTLEDAYGNLLPIPGNPSTLHVNLTAPLRAPGGYDPGGWWVLSGWCGRGPGILKAQVEDQVRATPVRGLNSCSDYKNMGIPISKARSGLWIHFPRGFRDIDKI